MQYGGGIWIREGEDEEITWVNYDNKHKVRLIKILVNSLFYTLSIQRLVSLLIFVLLYSCNYNSIKVYINYNKFNTNYFYS